MRHFGRLFYDSDDTSLLLLFSSVIVFRTILPCSALTLCSSRYIFPSWKSLVSIMRKISYLVFYILIGRKSCLIYRILLKLCKSQANPENPARNENPFGDPLAVVFIPCDSLRDCHSLLAASRVETDPAPWKSQRWTDVEKINSFRLESMKSPWRRKRQQWR